MQGSRPADRQCRRMRRSARVNAPATVDDYLARVPAGKRAALERLRGVIRSAAPDAVECISYNIPGYRLDGRLLFHFGATANHCAFYAGALPLETFADQLLNYRTSKGTIRFTPEHPLPAALVRKIVKARVAQRVDEASRRKR